MSLGAAILAVFLTTVAVIAFLAARWYEKRHPDSDNAGINRG